MAQPHHTPTSVLLKVKTHSFSVSIDTTTIYSFDKTGRLIGAYVNNINYRRGLDNRVLRKWSEVKDGVRRRHRRILSESETRELIQSIHKQLQKIFENRETYSIDIPGAESDAWSWYKRCLSFDYQALRQDSRKFRKIYKPVSILPPDQYYALVLQITEGCSFNECTFCNFYIDRSFRVKSPVQVERHIHSVNKFFGQSLGLRKSIFLADANAVIIPQKRLLKILEIIHNAYTIVPEPSRKKEILRRRRKGETVFDGIYSFIDLFTGQHKKQSDFAEMASLGLKRVYIGMESGSKPLLEFLNKPGEKEAFIYAVQNLKQSGIDVGIIILLGAGGKEYSIDHIRETADTINQMTLDQSDFIYFSDFHSQPGTSYKEIAEKSGITQMSYQEMRSQENQIRDNLIFKNPKTGPKITRYDIREFLY